MVRLSDEQILAVKAIVYTTDVPSRSVIRRLAVQTPVEDVDVALCKRQLRAVVEDLKYNKPKQLDLDDNECWLLNKIAEGYQAELEEDNG